MERVHEDSLLSPSTNLPLPSTPPLMIEASPSPPAPPRPAAGRPVRCRLEIYFLENVQAAESTPPVDSAPPSRPDSPDICCSQLRLQQYEEHIRLSRYPTPPDAPRKDQYISPSESESVSAAESLPPPAKVFHKGLLMYHKAHKGPEPIAYVDTRLYEGGNHDYYEVYDKRDLLWARRIDHLLTCYQVPRWTVK
jgi:hypothetical protein